MAKNAHLSQSPQRWIVSLPEVSYSFSTFISKQNEYGSSNLQNHCSDYDKAKSKANPKNVLLCFLLQHFKIFAMVFCKIILLITSNPVRNLSLKMDFPVPCCNIQQIFLWLSNITYSAIKIFISKSGICKRCFAESLY